MCPRCAWMDQGSYRSTHQGDIIAAMRDGAETYQEIAEATGRHLRSVVRAMALLLKSRRVRKWMAERDKTGDAFGPDEECRFRLHG